MQPPILLQGSTTASISVGAIGVVAPKPEVGLFADITASTDEQDKTRSDRDALIEKHLYIVRIVAASESQRYGTSYFDDFMGEAQLALVELLDRRPNAEPAYIFTGLKYAITDFVRRQTGSRRVSRRESPNRPETILTPNDELITSLARSALLKLRPLWASLLLWRSSLYSKALTFDEIAEALGINRSKASREYRKARRHLSAVMRKRSGWATVEKLSLNTNELRAFVIAYEVLHGKSSFVAKAGKLEAVEDFWLRLSGSFPPGCERRRPSIADREEKAA
jgi:RNA polymerase sigma factor (sigma-70 family)